MLRYLISLIVVPSIALFYFYPVFIDTYHDFNFLPKLETVYIYGIFVRLLGLLFVFQFATTAPQLIPFIGKHGVEPITYLLRAFHRDHGTLFGFFKFPTLFWINSSDLAIKILPWVGCACGLLVTYNGNCLALFSCWFIWLSIINANTNVFGLPWDSLLLESALWATMLPKLHPLPQLTMSRSPHPFVHLGCTFLCFRVMFGMGLAKFKCPDERTRNCTYTFHFLQWQPMSTFTSWYLRSLPMKFHKLLLFCLFTAEVLIPWLLFTGRVGRLIFAVSTLGLQFGIALCGNYGIFNVLTAILTLPLMAPSSIFEVPPPNLISIISFILLIGSLPYVFVLDSWSCGMWVYIPSKIREHAPFLEPVTKFFRIFAPFRIWNSYGIFTGRKNYPKIVPTLQMSMDGINWEDVVPKYMTNGESDCPKRFAPYHPRLDHAIFYSHCRPCDFKVCCLMGMNPYYLHQVGLVEKIAEHLYRGNPLAKSLFGHVPFHEPNHIRMSTFAYRMRTLSEVRESSLYWERELLGSSATFQRIKLDSSTGIHPCYEPFIFDTLEVNEHGLAIYKIGGSVVSLQRDVMIPISLNGMASESLNYIQKKQDDMKVE